jgi:hypothetical protein
MQRRICVEILGEILATNPSTTTVPLQGSIWPKASSSTRRVELYSAISSVMVVCRFLADVSSLEEHFKTKTAEGHARKESHACQPLRGEILGGTWVSTCCEVLIQYISFFFSSVRSLDAFLQKLVVTNSQSTVVNERAPARRVPV